jgi:plasmid stabilization system protein ParE
MPRGDKSKYTDKQERKADHIAESYQKRGVSEKEAESRAWATVNKDDGGGKKPGGSGRGARTGHPTAHKGGKAGGQAAASRPVAADLPRRRRQQRRESAMPPRTHTNRTGYARS